MANSEIVRSSGTGNVMAMGMMSIVLVSTIYAIQNVSSRNAAYEVYTPHSAYDKSEQGPLEVTLDLSGLAGRSTVEIWVKSSGIADFLIEGSTDGLSFRRLGTLSVPAGGGEDHEGFMNAYPVIRVSTGAPNDNEIEIVATR